MQLCNIGVQKYKIKGTDDSFKLGIHWLYVRECIFYMIINIFFCL